ncbi:hypothetical protein AI2905V1_4547 (plasmid) [Enterobacter cloacae]|nr:hypothetical protein AI2905V1_4547 [Enterobacter cloacae]CAH5920200.1 hypothetical protein AI2905V1_4547 [Enterobacter cloacae]CAH5926596.1 hypothetical protein AI2916V1_4539 [Enterobacter cloacae]
MSFVDNLMDMLKNGKEEDGAATARENLSQTAGLARQQNAPHARFIPSRHGA